MASAPLLTLLSPLQQCDLAPNAKNQMCVIRSSLDSLLMVPLIASPTNAMEMNKAMTSSVELGDESE